ncbi:diaminopimelate decarboxylase [Thermohalobacter berrensis]|uniref:Diaminopimelate decarboxylase n=1 Tax=Thermohalobacter berrensis TaxID=99594 RepID=A0A419T8Y8_9FIRM|nr:diaminopimelate decarboxylase [Thermohalobacter berrensis]RKD33926.1 diaminopimelate decarboxylase [Thermohalobacter berrensis]
MKLFGTMKINSKGHLEIGGCDSVDLVEKFKTPLYVIDEDLVRSNCRLFMNNFTLEGIETEVIYASKAFLNLAICKVLEEEGLSIDVVSGGELYTVLKAGFPKEKIHMHGNNKSKEELAMAVENEIGRIIIDNRQEIELLETVSKKYKKKVNVLLRVNPGIEAHTHEYIQTSKHDSKFGESIFSDDIYSIVNKLKESEYINLKGFHCHIGSQILDEEPFYFAAEIMLDFINKVKNNCDFITQELNLGGGFGVFYSNGDDPINLSSCLKKMLNIINEKTKELNIITPKIMIEPGRAITANAGITLYEIGGVKKTYSGKKYVFVDGGMTDNPRTALYGAKYSGYIANKMNHEPVEDATIGGKCCESGDIIIKNIKLPLVDAGDIMAVFTTGAYNYSMSSNYNKLLRPAVVFVKDGNAKLTVKRQTYEDLINNDIPYYQ